MAKKAKPVDLGDKLIELSAVVNELSRCVGAVEARLRKLKSDLASVYRVIDEIVAARTTKGVDKSFVRRKIRELDATLAESYPNGVSVAELFKN